MEKTILDMDFGDLYSVNSDTPVIQQADIKQGSEVQTVEDTAEAVVEKEETDDSISLIDALAANIEENTDDTTNGDDNNEQSTTTEETVDSQASANTDDDSSDSFALVFARYQSEAGNLTEFNEEEFTEFIKENGEEQALSKLVKDEVEINKSEIKNQYDTYNQEYIDLRESGVSTGEATDLVAQKEILEGISEEQIADSEDLRRDIITQAYKVNTSFNDAKIKQLVERSFDTSEDLTDAKEGLDILKGVNTKGIEEIKQEKIQAKKTAEENYKNYITSLKDTINKNNEIVPGYKINQTTKDKLEEMITKPVKQTKEGQALNGIWSKRDEDQIKFDTTLAYLIMNGVFDGKWDKFTVKEKTKATQQLKKHIDSKSKSSFTGGSVNTDSSTNRESAKRQIAGMRNAFK